MLRGPFCDALRRCRFGIRFGGVDHAPQLLPQLDSRPAASSSWALAAVGLGLPDYRIAATCHLGHPAVGAARPRRIRIDARGY